MPCPFPGMDPYLEQERLWPTVHSLLVNTIFQLLVPGLVERYRARVQERVYTLEQVLFTSVTREEHREPFLEIRHRSDNRLVTLLEVISPTNKTTDVGRSAYQQKRQEAQRQRAHLVEIDLVLEGQSLHDFSRETLPAWDYCVVVTRSPRSDQHDLYTATLDKRLPRFKLPLAGEDPQKIVDLQQMLHRVYEQGGFAETIDYQRDPPTRLSSDQRAWLDQYLREHQLRA
jgi:hypothetical protein